MTASILASLPLQPAALVLGMAPAVVWIRCRLKQQRDILQCRLCHIKTRPKKIEQHLLTQSCHLTPSRDCFSSENLQPAAFKHKCWVDVNENLKNLTTSEFSQTQKLLAQMIQIKSAICQVLNRLLGCLIKPVDALNATFSTQIVWENNDGQLSPRRRVLWEATISQPAQTLLEYGTIAFLNQPRVNPDLKNHPKDALRLLIRYRKLNRGTRKDKAVCCGKQILTRKQVGVCARWKSRGSTL